VFAGRAALGEVLSAGTPPHGQVSSLQGGSKSNTQCGGNTAARQPRNFLTFVGGNSLP